MMELPLGVAGECQQLRKGRVGVDKAEDSVDMYLENEVVTIREFQGSLKTLVEAMVKQEDANTIAQRKLQGDLRNKKLALDIDK